MPMDNTELNVVIPEVWAGDVIASTYDPAAVINRVQRKDAEVSKFGDIIHMPASPGVSVNDVTAATGAVTDQDITFNEAQLTVDKWKEVTIQLVEKAAKQSFVDAVAALRPEFTKGLMAQMSSDLLALYSDVTTNSFGDSNSQINEDLVLQAINSLLDRDLEEFVSDPNMVSLFLHTSQWSQAMKNGNWTDASITAGPEGGGRQKTVKALYGVPVFYSTKVASASSARQNLLFVRHALALAVQKNIENRELVSTGLARRYNANCLYGVKTRLEARAALIKTKA